MDDLAGSDSLRTVVVRIERGSSLGNWTVHFESEAVPGTLAAFAGVLSLEGLDITSAIIHKQGDTVRDSFDVEPLDGRTLSDIDERRLAALAGDALNGRLNLKRALADAHVLSGREVSPGRTDVETMSDSEITTGVRVRTPDRPGLLFALASTLSEHHMRTRSLTVVTFGGQAYDTFRVVDGSGAIVDDEALLDALRRNLRHAAESR